MQLCSTCGKKCRATLNMCPTCYPVRKMTRKIVTSFVFPPIPDRNNDWEAHFDGDEPNDNGQMLTGRGATEQEAIESLLELGD